MGGARNWVTETLAELFEVPRGGRRAVVIGRCAHCGIAYPAGGTRSDRIHCSDACRQAAYRARKAAG